MYMYTYACVGRQAPVVCGWAWKKHRFARGQRRSDWSERLFLIHAGVLSYMRANKRLPTPGPGGLAQYDPDGFRLLSAIYGGTHPRLEEVDPPA